MVLRSLSIASQSSSRRLDPKPGWEVFLNTEKQIVAPLAIIFQAEHSLLAGQLASALSRDAFGELPPEVTQAISEHDFGWKGSDQAQMESLDRSAPRPFPALSTQETLPSWTGSVEHGRSAGPLVYVLISRHFTMLGAGDPGRAEFVRAETERRKEAEQGLHCSRSDLDRWTGALGFLDLLSLCLCCGCQDPVELPMAHPADPASSSARKATLSWEKGSPRFTPPVIRPGAPVSLDVRSYRGQDAEVSPLRLDWSFANG